MNRWVMYVQADKLNKLHQIPCNVLGKDDQGGWVSVPTSDLIALYTVDPQAAVLYYSEESYQHAIHNLSEQEISVAINHRLKCWSPDALTEAVPWLYDLQHQSLALTAILITHVSPQEGPRLGEHFNDSINWLLDLSGEAADKNRDLLELLDNLTEWEATLIEEFVLVIEVAAKSNLTEFVSKVNTLIEQAKGRGAQIGNVLVQRGQWEGDPTLLPYMEVSRGIYIKPADKALIDGLQAKYLPIVVWNEGVITTLSKQKWATLQDSGKSVTVLYLDSGHFLQDSSLLTMDQLDRDFTERLENPPDAFMHAVIKHVGGILLHMAVMRRAALIRSGNEAPDLVILLSQQVNAETQILLDWLALKLQGQIAANQAIAKLQATEETIAANLNAMIYLAQRQAWSELVAILQEGQFKKHAAIDRLFGET